MPKYHAYLRVSTSRQAQKTGFARQLQSIERFCQREGIPLDHIWQERGISGCLLTRPTLGELLESAQPRDCVYIEDLTRLARKLAVQLQIVTLLIQKRVGVVACNTGENITDALTQDPMQRAMIQMQGVFAELERSQMLNRMAQARALIKGNPDHQHRTIDGLPKCEGRKRLTELEPRLLEETQRLKAGGMGNAEISRVLFGMGLGDSNGNLLSCTAIRRILQEC